MGRKPPGALRVPSLSTYVLVQLLGPVAILTLLLTSVIWLVTSLPLLDLVINRGQSAPSSAVTLNPSCEHSPRP